MRLYYLSRRRESSNWFVAFRDPVTNRIGTKRSTNTPDKAQAELIAQQWLRDGIPGKPNVTSITFADYLDQIWDYDSSPYVKQTLASGKKLYRRHAIDMRNMVKRYIRPYFGPKQLRKITEEDLTSLIMNMKMDRGYASATVNLVRNAMVKGIRFAKSKKLISRFDFELVIRCGSLDKQKRGILEPLEVRQLFQTTWRDPRSRLANLIAAETGMRMGEIRSLRICDVGIDRFFVRHSWSEADGGLKPVKNGCERQVPLSLMLKREIDHYCSTALVSYTNESFLIPSFLQNKPFDQRQIVKDLYKALESIGIDENERKLRAIVFHSWRHYVANCVLRTSSKSVGMMILGQKTTSVFDDYANHITKEDLQKMAQALESVSVLRKRPAPIADCSSPVNKSGSKCKLKL